MVTYVRSLCSSVGTEYLCLREPPEWKWCCGFGCRYLCCWWYFVTEYGVAGKNQKNKKWRSACLQLSLPILLLYGGGNWVMLSSLLEFQEKYVVTICCTASWAFSSSSLLKWVITATSTVHSRYFIVMLGSSVSAEDSLLFGYAHYRVLISSFQTKDVHKLFTHTAPRSWRWKIIIMIEPHI